ncbi:MAG: cytochrome c [Thermodesulfobacteriota bacterium]|nr:MAG: cytochrome c [Thermodesulfobacteriota bacterium]
MIKKVFFIPIFILFLSFSIFSIAETIDKQTALKRALQNNPSYKAALAKINSAAGERTQASLMPNPRTVFELENFGGSNQREGFERTELTLELQQKLEIAGKRRIRTEVADFGYKIVQEEALVQALRLLSETEYAFIRMAIAKERIELTENRFQLAIQTHDIVDERVRAAASPDMELAKANIEKTEAEIEKHHVEEDYNFARNDLARLLGLKNSDDLDIEADLSILPKLPDNQAVTKALKSSPQSQIQTLAKRKAQSSLDLAKANGIPDPTVGLGVRQFFDNDDTALVASLSFPLPFFDRNQGAVKSAGADVVRAEEQSRSTELSLQQSATQAWEIFKAELEIIHHYENEIIPSAKESYDQANRGYNLGAFEFLDLLDAQRTLNRVQSEYLDNLLELYEAKVQIDFLIGTYKPLIQNVSQNNVEDTKYE